MKKSYILVFLVIVAAAAGLIIAGCETAGNGVVPVPGGSGVIIISGIGATSLTLSWTKATDDASAPENIEYRAYYATVSSITTPEDVEANATAVGDWEKDIATKEVTGLSEATDYYFTVLVRDEDGNMAAYEVASQTTYMAVSITFNDIPAAADEICLDITGPEMDDIHLSLPVDTATFSVGAPQGSSRVFSAIAQTASVTSIGESSIDLVPAESAGLSAELVIDLYIDETKIIIPDALNNRIVQIDDMTGTGWAVKEYNNFGLSQLTSSSDFVPYDIDFDQLGRIYIAINNGSATKPQLIRIDDFNDTTADVIVSDLTDGLLALAVDRNNNRVYYTTSASPGALGGCDYNGTNSKTYANFNEWNPYGLAVDDFGMLYSMANSDGDTIIKYNPFTETQIDSKDLNQGDAWDVLVKSSTLYLLYGSAWSDPYNVVYTFNIDNLNAVIDKYGTQNSELTNPGDFLGPRRFVAILNKKLTVTDESDFSNQDRLVSFDDTLDGSGWEMYGEFGTGPDQFKFFYYYNIVAE